jgi:NADPH-dependent 2,4-dienoyl-CoA reductase/sulfur reductase-like enzyme
MVRPGFSESGSELPYVYIPGMSLEPPSTGVEQCQALVVGGGIAGAVAAIIARQHGLDVLLIDRSFFGTGGCSAVHGDRQ